MDGKATLKLRKPSKDNTQNLYLHNYDVIHCEYSFDKGITKEGQVRTEVLAGNIRVALPMLPTDELMAWVFDKSKKYNGEISINDAYEESLEKIYFEEGRCVGFRMHYEPAGSGQDVVLLLTINAQRMIIGDVEYKNRYN
ncbi:hypothetical protein M2451_003976 [Dysgonomonas sp. PFB1-18]|uniref:type VI secretion system tube protein TssD n=1 Tax=unclassified Dysgonomonas TaxID=2630389 RepID=UPI0024750298|nr:MULTISPECIES: type VI secretion system tube protein TssD [unclassified Dysgonomonas]MDH6311110.1 hypothetical protein [Dysgonomonas sp. PF1-14]MDH6340972.1 hypothetical protein [Dysgonomonas sp. PF1-16]MDH6382631.1 hypothetical protein [Dysgonomonas sp. PFB1-18]MDH6399978.1 hypothetical protein [Dysgonomonas sp. PF1-23]